MIASRRALRAAEQLHHASGSSLILLHFVLAHRKSSSRPCSDLSQARSHRILLVSLDHHDHQTVSCHPRFFKEFLYCVYSSESAFY
jgi:hypothetical protein